MSNTRTTEYMDFPLSIIISRNVILAKLLMSLIKIGPYGTGCEKEGGVETEVRERKKRMLHTF